MCSLGLRVARYSQVWWTSWSNELPKDIQQKFDGKVMAIVGVEMDQVRKTPQGDVSVPINIACARLRPPCRAFLPWLLKRRMSSSRSSFPRLFAVAPQRNA